MSSDKGIDWGRVEKYDVGCKVDKLSLTVAKSRKESDEDNQVNFPSESDESARPDLSSVQQNSIGFLPSTNSRQRHKKPIQCQGHLPWNVNPMVNREKSVAVVSFVLGVDCKVNSITVQT